MQNWTNTTYLKHGTSTQQAAYHQLEQLAIFETLQAFTPILAGTIPLDIALPQSDLDIICEMHDPAAFAEVVTHAYGHHANFTVSHTVIDDLPTVVINFDTEAFAIEIFGQSQPVHAQNAVRHLLIEARLLEIGGEPAKNAIYQLKASGLKTEPAFARYFQLSGDPYHTLLTLSYYDDSTLAAFLKAARR